MPRPFVRPSVSDAAEERLLLEIADAVEGLVKKSARADFGREIGMGADGTPTKAVDDLAEKEVLRIVESSREVRVNVLSEEAGFVDRGADATLVVDPIDGTTNAARGLPLYCIALAIGSKRLSDVRYGLVRNIPTGDTYVARRGKGAWRNGERLSVRAFDREDAIVSPELGPYAKREAIWLAAQKYWVRSFGSAALEMCFVAEGALDMYYFAPEKLRVTDIAASALIVREAGGRVYNASGEHLDCDLSLTPRTSVVAVGDDAALEVLEVFR